MPSFRLWGCGAAPLVTIFAFCPNEAPVRYVRWWGGWGLLDLCEREMAETVRDKRGSRRSSVADLADGESTRQVSDVHVLAAFEVAVRGVEVQLPPTAQHLIAYLAVAGRSVVRTTLASNLWLDSGENRALARLRNLIWKVGGIAPRLIVAGEQDVRLHPLVRVDLDAARATATRLLATAGAQPLFIPEGALDHDLLPEWDHEWLMVERQAFRVLRLRALEAVAQRRLTDSRFHEAEQACRTVIAAEPYRESVRLLLAEVCVAQGNVGLALSELVSFAALLESELGIGPNPEICDLMETIHATG